MPCDELSIIRYCRAKARIKDCQKSADARDLFAGDMERRRIKLMAMIAALVGSLDERPLFSHEFRSQAPPDLAFSHRNMSQWARH